MSTETATPLPRPRAGDDTIRRTVKALIAGRETKSSVVAKAIGVSPATFYRRLEGGGFSATEVVELAAYFRLRVEDLYSGFGGLFNALPPDDGNGHEGGFTVRKSADSEAIILPFPVERTLRRTA